MPFAARVGVLPSGSRGGCHPGYGSASYGKPGAHATGMRMGAETGAADDHFRVAFFPGAQERRIWPWSAGCDTLLRGG